MLAEHGFARPDLQAMRAVVDGHAATSGLDDERRSEYVLAVHEVVANSVQHGGGHGVLRVWRDGTSLVCEVRDDGGVEGQLHGEEPTPDQTAGRGLWLADQLCDLVEMRTSPAGTVVRLHITVS